MTLKIKIFTALSAVAIMTGGAMAVSLVAPATAQAQSAKSIVDSAIKRGVIGETPAGYLAEVGGASAAELAAMNEINIGRKSAYTKRARETNVQVDVYAAVIGEKQIAKSAPGTKVMTSSGTWRTK